MGSKDNSLRKKWQDYSGANAAHAEHSFFDVFNILFEGTKYEIIQQPKNFNTLYIDVPLSKQEIKEIYNPTTKIKYHGVKPDCMITNKESGKSIIVEIKRQDGWVEGGVRSNGRGNAHERLCKYFTPGLLKTFRQFCNLSEDTLPFWIIFQGDITRDPCRVREITLWFDYDITNFFFWRNNKDSSKLIDHFERYIAPIIE